MLAASKGDYEIVKDLLKRNASTTYQGHVSHKDCLYNMTLRNLQMAATPGFIITTFWHDWGRIFETTGIITAYYFSGCMSCSEVGFPLIYIPVHGLPMHVWLETNNNDGYETYIIIITEKK